MARYAKLYYWRGECHTLKRWAQVLDIPLSTLTNREWDGMRGDALFAPVLQVYNRAEGITRVRRLTRVIQNRKEVGVGTIHLEIELYYLRQRVTR